MLEVTTRAKEKLKEILQQETTDPEVAIRVTPGCSMSKRLDLVLSKEKKGDQVVLSPAGSKVLLIRHDFAQCFDGVVLHYKETFKGGDFVINKIIRH